MLLKTYIMRVSVSEEIHLVINAVTGQVPIP
jgi:hypothetical protein